MKYLNSIIFILCALSCTLSVNAESFRRCYISGAVFDYNDYVSGKNTYNIIINEGQKSIQFLKGDTNKLIAAFRIKTKKRGSKYQTIYTAINNESGRQITMEVFYDVGSSPIFTVVVYPIKNVSSTFKGQKTEFLCEFENYDE